MSMNLTSHQRTSDTWMAVTKYCEARLEELRRDNDKDHDPTRTAKIRGRIAEIQKFLRAGEEPTRDVVANADQS